MSPQRIFMVMDGPVCYYFLISILLASAGCYSSSSILSKNPVERNQGLKISYETRWFDQLTDHFTWANQDTFKQRYLVNTDHWCGDNCPILFYCGNEGDIEMFTNNTGWMWEKAAEIHAMLVFAEHRFYGQSMPYQIDPTKVTPDVRTTLGYLSSEQALADYARLIFALKNYIYPAKYSAVIALGGSYGGMLAAWLRMKYPNAVIGALAGSAPILQFPGQYECSQFNKIVTRDYENYSPNCSRSIARSWLVIRELANQEEGLDTLSEAFKTCTPFKDSTDAEQLIQFLAAVWVNMAMTDYANEATFLSKMPAYPVKHACEHLSQEPLNSSPEQLVNSLAGASQVYTNYTGKLDCLDVHSFLSDPMDVLWDFQSCTEMVMPICADGVNDMFDPQPFNLSSFTEDCNQRWGVRTQPEKIQTIYGDKSLSAASNIIFSSCSRDPWSAGCPQVSDESRSIHAIHIPGAVHHEDLRASGPNDTTAVKRAREQELNIVQNWIQLHYEQVKNHALNETILSLRRNLN